MPTVSRKFVLDIPVDAVFAFARKMNRHDSERARKEIEVKVASLVSFDYGCCREEMKVSAVGEKTAIEITITSEKEDNASQANLDVHATYLAWFDSLFDLRHGDEPRRVCVGCRVRLGFGAAKCGKCGKEYEPIGGAPQRPA